MIDASKLVIGRGAAPRQILPGLEAVHRRSVVVARRMHFRLCPHCTQWLALRIPDRCHGLPRRSIARVGRQPGLQRPRHLFDWPVRSKICVRSSISGSARIPRWHGRQRSGASSRCQFQLRPQQFREPGWPQHRS